MNRWIIPLDTRKRYASDARYVGGKAQNLILLNRYGFQTAPGFVITTNVFHTFILPAIEPLIQSLIPANRLFPESAKERVLSSKFNRRLEKSINSSSQKLKGLVAVRSSMVAEDRANMSFAGQLDTYLNIERSELLHSLKKCYASLFKPELQSYVAGHLTSVESRNSDLFSMAVIVQKMVKAIYSGIVFTADPISGRREIIIEATGGIGENIVNGKITPDRYVVNARGKISELNPVTENQPLLSPQQILHLAEYATNIARNFGSPQDIEWAWDGETFIFLQTRPISTLSGKSIYSSKLMSDMSPGIVKPLQWSTNTQAMSTQVFGRLFNEITGDHSADFSHAIRLIHSRVYANVTFFENLFKQIGLPINFFEMIARDEKGRRHRPPLTIKFLTVFLLRLLPFIWRYSRIKDQINEFVVKQNQQLDRYRLADWDQFNLKEKFERLEHLILLHNTAQWNIIITALNMTIRNTMMRNMVRKHAPAVEPSDLIKGLSGLKGLEPNRVLGQLSKHLLMLGETAVQCCLKEDEGKIRALLQKSDSGKHLLKEFDTFMKKFGYLSANTTNFAEVPWIENPKLIWTMIGNGALNKPKIEEENYASIRDERKKEVIKLLNRIQKPVFLGLLRSTIDYLDLREKISLLLSEDTYQFRRLILNLGKDLVNIHQLDQDDDIFYLFYDELETAMNKGMISGRLRKKIAKRRLQTELDSQIIPEDTICGDQIRAYHPVNVKISEFLTGICGSSGFKQGYAYVVDNPSNVNKVLQEDDILVVPFTHVGWTPLFSTIGGIIAESGGQLSHTSIIAREYGIPAVVNVHHATQFIKNGQPLTIDADSGHVYLKHVNSIKGD